MVSVIVPNWNGKKLLRDCLKSLQKLTYPNYELIVIDNGSSDKSVEMVRAEFPKVKLVISPINLGFGAACNLGIKTAKGEIIALFNNDAEAESSWLTKLVDAIGKEDDIAMVSGLIFYHVPCDVLWSAGARIDKITGMTYHINRGLHYNSKVGEEDVDYLPGCAIAFKKSLIDKIGFFDESFFIYSEELDWMFRAKRLGLKVKLDYSAVVWHKASLTRKRNQAKGYYHFNRGLFRIYFIHFPLKYIVTSLFFQLCVIPFFEILFFRTSPIYVLQRMKAFAWNILKLKVTILARNNANSMGKLVLKNRFKDFLVVAKKHISSKSYDF